MKRLAGTLVAALTLETLGAIAPWSGGPTLPKPSAYVATFTLWFMLGFAGIFGRRAARMAGQFSVLVLAAMAIIGPFGGKLTAAMQWLAGFFPAKATQAGIAPNAYTAPAAG